MTDKPAPRAAKTPLARLLAEPTLHFFAIAALALAAQRLLAGDPRSIEVTPALKSDLLRRYHDQLGRAPSGAEATAFMDVWKTEEALYREALRQGIDRDDAMVRNLLIAKMRERLLLGARIAEPTDAELAQFLAEHRADYEAPLIYEHEFVAFPRQAPRAEQDRESAKQRLVAGATPGSLQLRSTVANVNGERMDQEFGAEVAEQVRRLPPGEWRELQTADRLLLVKLAHISGGLPPPEVLKPRLVAGWQGAMAEKALGQATKQLAAQYRFSEQAR